MIIEKRYQRFTREGIEWSKWFIYRSTYLPKWQLKNKLLNEYRNAETHEPIKPREPKQKPKNKKE